MRYRLISVKLVIFTISDGKLMVFLPDKKLPHKSVYSTLSLDEIVGIITKESLGKIPKTIYLEQLYTFSSKEEITVTYFLLIQSSLLSAYQFKKFVSANGIGEGQDVSIIKYALQRLRWKIEYTNVVYSLLPDDFSLGELQGVYEAILGKTLDKRNFRKKIQSLGIITTSGKKRTGVQARPAQLYCFKSKKPVMVKVFS